MGLEVIGAGFGRTGTTSLKIALEQLGLPCYHMTEVFKNHHVSKWIDVAEGRADWNGLFKNYKATLDWPAMTFYKELMEEYPEAKVILTVRDPNRWYDSCMQTVYPSEKEIFFSLPPMNRFRDMTRKTIWEITFQGKFEDREYALEVFRKHTEEVKKHVRTEKLLVFEVSQGWEPLCKFLGVEVPSNAFPHVNDTVEFNNRIKNMKRFLTVALIVVVSVVILLFAFIGRWVGFSL